MLNINQVKTFTKVVEEGSLTTAATQLDLTQPAVSLHIQNLEDYFGTILLDRKGRNIGVTPAGKILYREGKELLRIYEDTGDRIFSQITSLKKEIKIGAGPIMTDYIMPHIIALFRKEHADIKVTVDPAETDVIVKGVTDHTFDLGFIGISVKNNKIQMEEWIRDELVVITTKEHPLARKGEVNFAELINQDMFFRSDVTGIRRFLEQRIQIAGLKLPPLSIIEVPSTLSVLASVQAGLGISVISRRVAESVAAMGMVSQIRVKDLDLKRKLYIIRHKFKRLPDMVQEFIRIAHKYPEKTE